MSQVPPSSHGGSQSFLTAPPITFAHAAIKALPSGTVELVAAQGAGRIIVPLGTVYCWKRTLAYTNVDPTGYMVMSNPGDSVEYGGYTLTGSYTSFFGGAGDANWYHQGLPADSSGGVAIRLEPINAGEALHLAVINPAGDFTGGAANNTLTVTACYAVIDAP